jgi:hypothetical protein
MIKSGCSNWQDLNIRSGRPIALQADLPRPPSEATQMHRGNQFSGRDSSARGYREGKSRDARYIAQMAATSPFAANSGYVVTEGSKAQPPFRQPSHAQPRENLQQAQIAESVDFVAPVVQQLGRHILGEVLGLCGSARTSSSRRECS